MLTTSLINMSASANSAVMFCHTTSAWSAMPLGVVPSGAVGTTPLVCRIRVAPVLNIACT